MLRREIHRILPDARIVDVVAAVDVINIQNICDLVISTVQIQSIVPVLVVHPILTDYDRKMILGNHLITRWTHRSEGNQVLDVAAKYMDPEQFQAFKQELTQSKGGSSDPFSGDAPKTAGLVDYLKMDRVTLTQDAFRWTEAVRFAGKTLIECGSIDRKYVDNIISQLRFYGPYMFVAKGLLLAHAKPEDGANQLDVAMTVFKKPVRFSEFYEAKIIITLSMKDQEQASGHPQGHHDGVRRRGKGHGIEDLGPARRGGGRQIFGQIYPRSSGINHRMVALEKVTCNCPAYK